MRTTCPWEFFRCMSNWHQLAMGAARISNLQQPSCNCFEGPFAIKRLVTEFTNMETYAGILRARTIKAINPSNQCSLGRTSFCNLLVASFWWFWGHQDLVKLATKPCNSGHSNYSGPLTSFHHATTKLFFLGRVHQTYGFTSQGCTQRLISKWHLSLVGRIRSLQDAWRCNNNTKQPTHWGNHSSQTISFFGMVLMIYKKKLVTQPMAGGPFFCHQRHGGSPNRRFSTRALPQ